MAHQVGIRRWRMQDFACFAPRTAPITLFSKVGIGST